MCQIWHTDTSRHEEHFKNCPRHSRYHKQGPRSIEVTIINSPKVLYNTLKLFSPNCYLKNASARKSRYYFLNNYNDAVKISRKWHLRTRNFYWTLVCGNKRPSKKTTLRACQKSRAGEIMELDSPNGPRICGWNNNKVLNVFVLI